MEEYGVELEVYENVEDFQDYLKKKKVFLILFVLIIIASIILVLLRSPWKIGFKTPNSIITSICLILGSIIFSIFLTIITYKVFIKSYSHWFDKNPNYHRYTIKLYSDYILITRPNTLKFERYEIKVLSSEKCFFIEYKKDRITKEVCMINKTNCSENAKQALEKLLEK